MSKKEEKDWTFRQLAAEFIATGMFVWGGCGAAISSNRWAVDSLLIGPSALTSIALGFGLSITVLAYMVGHISGGHINPAVTLAFMLLRLQSITAGLLFMVAQCLGAVFGALILWGQNVSITAHCGDDDPNNDLNRGIMTGVCAASELPDGNFGPAFGLGVNTLDPRVSQGCAFFIEMMGTFLLVLTVLMVAVHKKSGAGNTAPIAIGWAVLVCHLQLIPYTGCGINPARSFGPMVVDAFGGMNNFKRGWWVFYTAPFVGSAIATATYYFIFAETDVEENEEIHDHTAVRESTFDIKTPNQSGTKMLGKNSSEFLEPSTDAETPLQQNDETKYE